MDIGINIFSHCGNEKVSAENRCILMSKYGFKYTFCLSNTPFASQDGLKLLDKYGIRFDSLHAPFKNTNDIWKNSEKGNAVLSELFKGVDKCEMLGVPTLVVHLTNAGFTPRLCDIGFSRFDSLFEYAVKKNVTIAYENIGSMRVLKKIYQRQPDAKFCYDTGHERCFSFFRDFMPKFASRLVTTHIQDNRCLPFLDDHRLPFDAKINFDKVARSIAEANYDGVLMLEVISSKSKMYKDMTAEEYYKRASDSAKKLAEMIEKYKNA